MSATWIHGYLRPKNAGPVQAGQAARRRPVQPHRPLRWTAAAKTSPFPRDLPHAPGRSRKSMMRRKDAETHMLKKNKIE